MDVRQIQAVEKPTAEQLMEALAWMEHPLSYYADVLDQLEEGEERDKLRRAVADMMGRHFTELMIPILRLYPELDPERNAEWWSSLKEKYEVPGKSREDE